MPMEDHLRPWDQADFERKLQAFKTDWQNDPFFQSERDKALESLQGSKQPMDDQRRELRKKQLGTPVERSAAWLAGSYKDMGRKMARPFEKWLYPTREQHQAAVEDVRMRGEDVPPSGGQPVLRENAAARANQKFQRSFGPKRPENVAGAKSLDMRHGNAAHGVGSFGGPKNEAAIALGGDLRTGRKLMQSGASLGTDIDFENVTQSPVGHTSSDAPTSKIDFPDVDIDDSFAAKVPRLPGAQNRGGVINRLAGPIKKLPAVGGMLALQQLLSQGQSGGAEMASMFMPPGVDEMVAPTPVESGLISAQGPKRGASMPSHGSPNRGVMPMRNPWRDWANRTY